MTDGTGTIAGATDNGDGTGTFTTTTGGGPVTVPTVPAADAAYALDGVPLSNSTLGWRVKFANTNPFAPISRALADFNASGRDGTIQVRGFTATPTVTFVVSTPQATLADLRQLFRLGTTLALVDTPTVALTVELVSLNVETVRTGSGGLYNVTAVLRAPQVNWRDTTTTDYGPTALTTSGQAVTVFGPSSAPVRDALICVKGSVTGLAVRGSDGTYFSYAPNVPSGTYLTFDATTGRAWTGASAFQKTTEVTGSIQNGPGPYYLELLGVSNPAVTGSTITVTWTAASGATITVRGANSYDQ